MPGRAGATGVEQQRADPLAGGLLAQHGDARRRAVGRRVIQRHLQAGALEGVGGERRDVADGAGERLARTPGELLAVEARELGRGRIARRPGRGCPTVGTVQAVATRARSATAAHSTVTKRGRTFTPPACRQARMRLRQTAARGRIPVGCMGTASCGWPPARCARRSATPRRTPQSVLRVGARMRRRGRRAGDLPRADALGYSIEDILLQDTLLTRPRRALADVVEGSAELLPVLVVGLPVRYRHRILNVAAVVHRGRLLGLAPKSYLPTYREFYERRQVAPGDDVAGTVRVAGAEVPIGPDLLFAAEDLPGFVLHVEICEDMWVPVPPSAEAALAGATVLANLSGSPITDRPGGGPQAAGALGVVALPRGVRLRGGGRGRVVHRPRLGRPDDDLGERRPARRVGALPQGRAPLGRRRRPRPAALRAAADGHVRRQPPPPRRPRRRPSAPSAFRLDPPVGDIGLRREVERFPFVPADPARLEQDCYEAYNIQVAGLEQRLRAIGNPKVVIGVSGGLDSTHALIVAARAMDREGRPRSDILGFTLPGFATGTRTKGNAHRLMRGPRHHVRGARHHRDRPADAARTWATRSPRASRCTTSRSRTSRPGCAPTTCSARPTSAAGSCWAPATSPSWRWAGARTASATRWRTTTSTRGVPKTLIQHLIRWVASSKQFDDEVNEVLLDVLDTEITPGARARPARTRRCRAARPRWARTRCRTSPSSTSCATASARRRSRSWPWHAWRDADDGRLAAGLPRRRAPVVHARGDPALARGVRAAGSSSSASSSARRCRTARRCRRAARCPPAATGAPPRTCRPGSGWTRSPPPPRIPTE